MKTWTLPQPQAATAPSIMFQGNSLRVLVPHVIELGHHIASASKKKKKKKNVTICSNLGIQAVYELT